MSIQHLVNFMRTASEAKIDLKWPLKAFPYLVSSVSVAFASASATAAASSSPPDCSVAEVSPPPPTGVGASASSQTLASWFEFTFSSWWYSSTLIIWHSCQWKSPQGSETRVVDRAVKFSYVLAKIRIFSTAQSKYAKSKPRRTPRLWTACLCLVAILSSWWSE